MILFNCHVNWYYCDCSKLGLSMHMLYFKGSKLNYLRSISKYGRNPTSLCDVLSLLKEAQCVSNYSRHYTAGRTLLNILINGRKITLTENFAFPSFYKSIKQHTSLSICTLCTACKHTVSHTMKQGGKLRKINLQAWSVLIIL